MKRRVRQWLLAGLGLLILWLGLSATGAISHAYEAACSTRPRCPAIRLRIFLFDVLVIACALYLPLALKTLFDRRDGGAPR
jgi:hypothetical protein